MKNTSSPKSKTYLQYKTIVLQTRERLEHMRTALDATSLEVDNLMDSILKDFHEKAEKAVENAEAQVDKLQTHLENHIESKMMDLVRRQALSTKNQLVEIDVKVPTIA